MDAIQPFWDIDTLSETEKNKEMSRRKLLKVIPQKKKKLLDNSIDTSALDTLWNDTTLHCGMLLKDSFFYSIKKHAGKEGGK